MNTSSRLKLILAALPLSVVLVLFGCGGGGSGGTTPAVSTVIQGTAAAGVPVVGYVSVSDSSSNPQPVKTNIPIEANGNYSVDVTGLTAPFAFLADGTVGGKRVQLYSAALQADVGGTINITPFTDLMIRNIAGSISTTLVDAIINKLPGLTDTELNTKRVELTTQLAPVLTAAGLSASIDLLRESFNADSTGLDRFMDLVKVDTTVPTAVTITNILDASAPPLTLDTSAGTYSGSISTANVTSTATPVDLIVQTFNTFSGFFATGLPASGNAGLTALFSSTFMEDGNSGAVFLNDITSNPSVIGLKFTNVVVDSVDTVNGIALVHFRPLNAAGVSMANDVQGGSIAWQMKFENGAWKVHGNQRIAYVGIKTTANKWVCGSGNGTGCSLGTTYTTGLHLYIDDQAMVGIGSAVVTGPGLGAGVTLTSQLNQSWLSIVGAGCGGCTTDKYDMADLDITGMGVGPYTYTVKLYDNALTPVLLATYTEVIPVAPVLNTVLQSMAFPAMSNMSALAGYAGGTLTPAWTVPAGLWGDCVSASVWTTNDNQWVCGNEALGKTATSGTATLVLTAPGAGGAWTSGNYWISTWDQYGGKVETNYQ